MAYPFDLAPKKLRVLEALQANLQDIRKANSFHHDVRGVFIYQGERVLTGTAMPVIVIAPVSRDEHTRRLGCAQVEHSLPVSLYLALDVMPGSEAWHAEMTWLVADVVKTIEDDIQLGGLAVFHEVSGDEIFDVGAQDKLAVAQVDVSISYRHQVGNPTV